MAMMHSPSAEVFNDFAHSIGVDINTQMRQDSLALLYDDKAELHVQYTDNNELFAVLRRPLPDYKLDTILPLALQMCHWDKHLHFPVQAGYKTTQRDHWLVFIICLDANRIAVAELQQATSLLRDFDKRILESLR